MFSFSLISFSGLSSSHRDLASQVSRSKTRTKTNPAKTSELNPKLQIFEGLFLMIQGPFLMNFLFLPSVLPHEWRKPRKGAAETAQCRPAIRREVNLTNRMGEELGDSFALAGRDRSRWKKKAGEGADDGELAVREAGCDGAPTDSAEPWVLGSGAARGVGTKDKTCEVRGVRARKNAGFARRRGIMPRCQRQTSG